MERYRCKCGCGKIISKVKYKQGRRFFNCKHANIYNGKLKMGTPRLKHKEQKDENTVA